MELIMSLMNIFPHLHGKFNPLQVRFWGWHFHLNNPVWNDFIGVS